MPPTETHALTEAEFAEALASLVTEARKAADDGNDLRYIRRHEQINAVIDQWRQARTAVPA